MSKILHVANDDNNDAKAIAIPQVFSKNSQANTTAAIFHEYTQVTSIFSLSTQCFQNTCIFFLNPFPHNDTF